MKKDILKEIIRDFHREILSEGKKDRHFLFKNLDSLSAFS